MSKSLIVAGDGSGTAVADNTTNFNPIAGDLFLTTAADEVSNEIPIRDAGSFSNLFAYVSANSASVSSTITLRKSQADTALTVTYTSDQTGIKEDTANSVAFASTDEATWEITVPDEGGLNAITVNILACEFTPDTASDCISFFSVNSTVAVSSEGSFFQVPCGDTSASTTEANSKFRVMGTVTSSDFYTSVGTNSRTTSTVFVTRKNGADGGQTVTYTSTQTGQKEDTAGSDSLAAGDDFNYSFVTGAGTENLRCQHISTTIISTAGEFSLLQGDSAGVAVAANTTTYFPVSGSRPNTTEAKVQVYPRFTFTAKELGAYVSVNSGVSLSSTITLRDNGADGTLTVSYLVGQTGLKNDSVNEDTITLGTDEIDYEVTCNDLTGGITITWIGIIGFTAAAATWPGYAGRLGWF